MSGFIGGALPQFVLDPKDGRNVPPFMKMDDARARGGSRHAPGNEGYYSGYWPRSDGFIGAAGSDVSMMAASGGRKTERVGAGVASRLGFVGITRDTNGNILGGVTCSLFLTATKAWIMDVVSDANGAFLLQTFYSPDTHFIVFWKSGTPNLFDATDQTLTGS